MVQRLTCRKRHSYATQSNNNRVVKTPWRSMLPRNRRTVNRAYGDVLSGSAVRERIIGGFVVEEQKKSRRRY
ncbi:hypothetical protein MLD38_022523 [Melastoma candidum]|uniref:Uncharacterized protein n=1 Tax=Melastoma candidum TaxID=119954 RepID=A0ACB9QJK3_9MYRT|nr:hypothetical protein MLD38_022523 [Melastoma candidum]